MVRNLNQDKLIQSGTLGQHTKKPGLSWQNQDSWNVWFRDKVHEILSPKLVHKSWQQTPKSALIVGHTSYYFFCNQTWQRSINHAQFRLNHFFFIYERTLFANNFSNIKLQPRIHFLHNPVCIDPALQKATLLLFCTQFVWPFIFNVILFMECQHSMFHGTSNGDNRTAQ